MCLFHARIGWAEPIKLSPIIGFGQEMFNFSLSEIKGNKDKINYEPNIAGITRLGVNAYGFGVGYSIRSTEDPDPLKGSTDFFDFQLGYHNKKWGADLFVQEYKGFYSEDTPQIQTFPDLRFQHYGVLGRYAIDESEFSVASLMDQSEDIKTTAGKIYIVTGFSHHEMQTDISLMQQDYVGTNPETEALRKMQVTSVHLGAGAGKYWVSTSRWFAGALLDMYGTYGLYTYENDMLERSSSSYGTVSFNIRAGFGYAGEKFKSGFSLAGDKTTLRVPGSGFMNPQAVRVLLYFRIAF